MGRTALVVRGGWEGHSPVEATDRFADVLRHNGYQVTLSETLDSYLDPSLAANDLIVQCWTMGTITNEQLAGLSAAIGTGTGFAGWHGGFIDAFRATPGYQLITGGQFIYHPKGFVDYRVRPAAGKQDHPIIAGLPEFDVHTEQYFTHVDPLIDVLAVTDYVDDPDLPGVAGTTVPVTWTTNWGAGRVFVTTLGHQLSVLDQPPVREMITRGMLWASR